MALIKYPEIGIYGMRIDMSVMCCVYDIVLMIDP